VVSSSGCAAILRACARRRSSSCRLVVSVSMPGNAAHCFRFRQCSGNCKLRLGDLLGTAAGGQVRSNGGPLYGLLKGYLMDFTPSNLDIPEDDRKRVLRVVEHGGDDGAPV
jgi:hypothetical protein